MVVSDVYSALKQERIVGTQAQFSLLFMGKSPRYYSYLLAANREPSIETAYALAVRLDMLAQRLSQMGKHSKAVAVGELAVLMHENVKMRSLAALPVKRPRSAHAY